MDVLPARPGPATPDLGQTKAVELRLPLGLLKEAEALGVDVLHACESGLLADIRRARGEAWLRENAAAIDSWNAYVEEHGLPLEAYRQF